MNTMLDEQPEDQDSPAPKVIDAPLHIWLVYGELERDDTHAEFARHDDSVTWCEDKQFESDVLYVRADDVDRLRAQCAAWKEVAEHHYGLLRVFGGEYDYPVTGALDAWAVGRHPVLTPNVVLE